MDSAPRVGALVSIGTHNLGRDRYEFFRCVTCSTEFPRLPHGVSCNGKVIGDCPFCAPVLTVVLRSPDGLSSVMLDRSSEYLAGYVAKGWRTGHALDEEQRLAEGCTADWLNHATLLPWRVPQELYLVARHFAAETVLHRSASYPRPWTWEACLTAADLSLAVRKAE